MNPNMRRLKAPPLPKFEENNQPAEKMNEKVADFLSQISKESPNSPMPEKASAPAPVEKKKANLASINSKLSSIMNSKKIDLNKVVLSKKIEP